MDTADDNHQQLDEMQSRITALLSIAADAIIAIDAAHRITVFNEGAEIIFGYKQAEILGQPLNAIIPQRFHNVHDRHLTELEAGPRAARRMGERQEIFARRKDGSEFPAEASIAMVGSKGERTFLAVLRDVSERKRTERLLSAHADELEMRVRERTLALELEIKAREEAQAQLVQSQRMEAFGQLTGGVAHDFNNLLTIITGNLEILDSSLDDSKSHNYVRRAIDAAEMGARLTSRLLTFARRRHLEPRRVDINELVLGMAELFERVIGVPITLSTILDPNLWATRADPSEIENAVLNLAINARDAMPDGGKLIIETRNTEFDAHDEGAVSGLTAGQYVVVSVTDTGAGMAPEIVKRAFEPFFTTKPTGKSTGLGLSTIYGFAQQSGGQVTLYSELGKGTTVSLYLPRDGGVEGDRDIAGSATVPLSENNETVLVVEDNPEVREVTLQRIEALGYVVREASSGAEAIAVLKGDPEIALVFSDVVMAGGMSGLDLERWIKEHSPHIKVLLTTGFSAEAIGSTEHGDRPTPILPKPYSRLHLARAIHDALSGD
ncbi:MAG: PAS domain S-box protein [Hyphomicrobium sp.]